MFIIRFHFFQGNFHFVFFVTDLQMDIYFYGSMLRIFYSLMRKKLVRAWVKCCLKKKNILLGIEN